MSLEDKQNEKPNASSSDEEENYENEINLEECPNIDIEDEGILLIMERYIETGFRMSGSPGNSGFQNYRELRTIFYKSDYEKGLDDNDTYLDAISKGNVILAIDLITNKGVKPLYIKWEWQFGTAHALHYILQNLKHINSKAGTQHPKYKELIEFIKQYLLPNMNETYINTKYFRGGDVLNRGTRRAIMEMIISVNDVDLLKLMVNSCKDMIHFNEKSLYFGGSAYGSKEYSILDDCIDNSIDINIFEFLLTEPGIGIDVNEYINSHAGFISGESTKYTILHKIIKTNKVALFKKLMLCENININSIHESVKRKMKGEFDSDEYRFADEKTSEMSLHIAIKNNNECLTKLLIINGIDVSIDYLITIDVFKDKGLDKSVEKMKVDVFSFIDKIKDKTIEMDKIIVAHEFDAGNMKNIVKQRYFPDMMDEYPLNIQQCIQIILFRFPNIGEIILEYFL